MLEEKAPVPTKIAKAEGSCAIPVTRHLPRRTELEKGQAFPSSPPPPPPPLLFLLNRSNYMYLPKPRQPTIATNDTAMPAAFSAPEIKAL